MSVKKSTSVWVVLLEKINENNANHDYSNYLSFVVLKSVRITYECRLKVLIIQKATGQNNISENMR